MTEQELYEKYDGRRVDAPRLFRNFRMMGKFGQASVYTTSFNTAEHSISIEIIVEDGEITGITPEKLPRDDGWGVSPDAGPADILPEEYDRIAMYLDSVCETQGNAD